MFQTKFGDTIQTHISCWVTFSKIIPFMTGYIYVGWVRIRSLHWKSSVMCECMRIQSHVGYMCVCACVSFQHIIMQAARRHRSESWQWKGTWPWTWWSTIRQTQIPLSCPQSCDWIVIVAIVDIFDLFQPNLEWTDKLPYSRWYKIRPMQAKQINSDRYDEGCRLFCCFCKRA